MTTLSTTGWFEKEWIIYCNTGLLDKLKKVQTYTLLNLAVPTCQGTGESIQAYCLHFENPVKETWFCANNYYMKRSSPLNRQFALACSMNSMRKVLSNLKRKLKCSHFRRPAVAIAMATTQLTATNALLSIKYAITVGNLIISQGVFALCQRKPKPPLHTEEEKWVEWMNWLPTQTIKWLIVFTVTPYSCPFRRGKSSPRSQWRTELDNWR